jgi:hypothetical protein
MPERIQVRRDLGSVGYHEWQIDRIPLPGGRPGVVCYFRDISQHVRARQARARATALTSGQKRWRGLLHPDDREGAQAACAPTAGSASASRSRDSWSRCTAARWPH